MPRVFKIGILEVQGGFLEHKIALTKAQKHLIIETELHVKEVRQASHLAADLDGLIIPGGESTAISHFIKKNDMEDTLKSWIKGPRHVTWGTCAGMILLSKRKETQIMGAYQSIGVLNTVVSRNFFGRQVQSFEAEIKLQSEKIIDCVPALNTSFNGVFIRAPAITEITSSNVNVLATLPRSGESEVVVAVEEGNIMATAFHPELTEDIRWHLYFLKKIENSRISK